MGGCQEKFSQDGRRVYGAFYQHRQHMDCGVDPARGNSNAGTQEGDGNI